MARLLGGPTATRFQRTSRALALALLLVIGLLAIAIAATQTAWFKDWVRRYVTRQAAQYLNAELSIGRVDGNLFTGVELERVTLNQGSETIVSAKDVGLDYNVLDFLSGGIVIDAIRINEPRLLLKRDASGWNLAGLVKEQAQEADREGPARPVRIGAIGISNGAVTIVDTAGTADAVRLPARIVRIDLKGAFDYKPVDFRIELAHLSFRAEEPNLALNSLSGVVRVNEDDVTIEPTAVRTAESSLSIRGAVHAYLATPTLDITVSSDRLTPRELAGFVPALAQVRVDPAFELTARGTLESLETRLDARSKAGAVRAQVVADAMGPERGVRGEAAVSELDLSQVAEGLPASRVNASANIDLALDAANALAGRADVRVAPTVVDGYRVDALDANARIADGRVRLDARARAYGAQATATGTVVPPTAERALSADLTGRVSGLDVQRLPRRLGAPRLATRIAGRYHVTADARAQRGEVVFDESRVEGAAIDAGTRIAGSLGGGAPVFSARGAIRDVEPARLGRALKVQALIDDRLPESADLTFDVEGRGRTLQTLDARGRLGVTHAAVVGGEVRDVVVDATLAQGAVSATLAGQFTNLDPARAAQRPDLAGAVSGAIEASIATPDVTAFALPASSGRVQLTLEPSRIAGQTIDRATVSATLREGVLDVAALDVASPLATVSVSGPVALTESGQSNLRYRVEAADLAPLAALAGQPAVAGAATLEGGVTGNRTRLQTSGDLSLSQVAHVTTARATDADVHYDVTLPELDPARVSVQAKTRASLVEVAGRSLREVSADVQYAERTASFSARVSETELRSADVAGALALMPQSGIDLRLDRLTLAADDVTWSLTSPARVRYADDLLDVDRLALASGEQRIEAGGAFALGSAATSRISSDRPLRLTIDRLDLAAADRLAQTGRGLAGTLTATAVASGSLESPVAEVKVGVRGGRFGDFAYDAFDATLTHDADAARIDARLDQGTSNIRVSGALPPAPVLRDEARRRTAPLDVKVQTSAIDLGVAQAFTTALREVTGTLQADVHVTGTAAAPAVDGRVAVTGGAFTVAAAGTRFTGLEADVGLSRERLDIRRLQLADQDGHLLTLTGGAGVSLANRALGDVEARLAGTDFRVLEGDFGKLSLDLDLSLKGAWPHLRVDGSLGVRDGRIEIDRVLEEMRPAAQDVASLPPPGTTAAPGAAGAGDPAPTAASQPEPAAPPAPSLFDAVAVNVNVHVPNNLVIRGDGVKLGGRGLSLGDLNMTLGGDLRATKQPQAPTLVVGSIRTVRGFYEFQGRRFELRRDGTVSFKGPDPTNPRVDVTALREIAGVEARVRVHGEAQKPALELSSTPPLDEGDILSLIIFNRPINDLGEGEKTALAQRAGSIAGGFVAAPVAEALRDALDLDLLEITPIAEDGASSVSIGNQIGEKVFVKVRQQFGSSETTQLILEYELSNLLRLETSVAQGGDTTKTVGRRAERGGADLVFVIKY